MIVRLITFSFTLIMGITNISKVISQERKVRFEQINVENGLSQSSVSAIIQDQRGFMWFGTQDGLNKYNGYEFEIYRFITNDSTTISDNWINDLCEDTNGNIWVATSNGLNKYLKRKNRFERIKFKGKNTIKHKNVNVLFKDNNDNIWVGSRQGLSKITINKSEDSYVHYSPENRHFLPFKNKNITSITQDLNGDIWVGTHSSGIIKFTYQKGEIPFFKVFKSETGTDNSILSNNISKLLCDSNGNIWIGSDLGLNKYHIPTNTYYNYLNEPPTTEQIRGLFEDSKGFVWIGTHSNGVYRYDVNKNIFDHFTNSENRSYSLSNDNVIRSIFEDSTGIIWIGTLLGGANKYDPSKFKFRHYKREGISKKTLSNNLVRCFFSDKNGYLWVGTENGGLNCVNENFSLFRQYPQANSISQIIPKNRIYSITNDKAGNIWIATMRKGAFRIKINNKSQPIKVENFIHYEDKERKRKKLIISNVFSDLNNDIWLCEYNGRLLKFNNITQKFEVELEAWRDSLSVGVINDKPQSVKVDSNGKIWIGSIEGLLCFDPDQKKIIRNFKNNTNQYQAISNTQVKVIHQRKNGKFWLGTNKGLVSFNPKTELFKNYNTEAGLPNNMIYGVLEDEKENLWLSTNKGISRFNLKTKTFENFDVSDGLQADEFNTWAYYKAPKGEMYFGGINGFNAFYPDEIKSNSFPPKIAFTGFKLFNKEVSIQEDKPNITTPLLSHISETEEIILNHKQNVLTFEFSTLHFTAPKANKYAYQLEGFDDGWNYRNWDKRSVTYTNLEPGKYVLRVKASNNDGLWNEEGISLKLIIKPPLYKTIWFQVISVFIGVIIIIIAYNIRTSKFKKRQEELKREVLVKTARLRYNKEEITAQAEKLKMANNFIQAVNEDITHQKHELEKKKNEIELQAEELKDAQKTIKEQNKKLQNANFLLEDTVKKRTEELENALAELDHFIYRSAHDLRGPIARLLGLVNLGKLETDDEKAIETFDRIEIVSKNLGDVLSRLVRVQDIKDRVIELSEVDVNIILDDIFLSNKIYESFPENQLHLKIPSNVCIKTDGILFKILIENIVLNAVQFKNTTLSNNSFSITVNTIGTSKLVIWLRDNGIGIPPEIREKVFDMFYIGTEISNGPGLGLYEVKIILEKLKGTIKLSTSNNNETEFMIILPTDLEAK